MDPEAIEAVLPPRVKSGPIWHYTSPETGLLILKTQAIWASAVSGMNDSGELTFGMDTIRQRWVEVGATVSNWERIDRWIELADLSLHGQRIGDSFVISGTLQRDSVVQWGMYGTCALGIDPGRILTKVPSSAPGVAISPTFTTGWRAVIYDIDAQAAHVDQLVSVLDELAGRSIWTRGSFEATDLDATGVECILRALVYLKSAVFAHEREVRLYGQASSTGALVESHSGAFGSTTHISVKSKASAGYPNHLPISEIRIANSSPQAAAQADALRQKLRDLHSGATVTLVETQYRRVTP